jgi:hypothetical protein
MGTAQALAREAAGLVCKAFALRFLVFINEIVVLPNKTGRKQLFY